MLKSFKNYGTLGTWLNSLARPIKARFDTKEDKPDSPLKATKGSYSALVFPHSAQNLKKLEIQTKAVIKPLSKTIAKLERIFGIAGTWVADYSFENFSTRATNLIAEIKKLKNQMPQYAADLDKLTESIDCLNDFTAKKLHRQRSDGEAPALIDQIIKQNLESINDLLMADLGKKEFTKLTRFTQRHIAREQALKAALTRDDIKAAKKILKDSSSKIGKILNWLQNRFKKPQDQTPVTPIVTNPKITGISSASLGAMFGIDVPRILDTISDDPGFGLIESNNFKYDKEFFVTEVLDIDHESNKAKVVHHNLRKVDDVVVGNQQPNFNNLYGEYRITLPIADYKSGEYLALPTILGYTTSAIALDKPDKVEVYKDDFGITYLKNLDPETSSVTYVLKYLSEIEDVKDFTNDLSAPKHKIANPLFNEFLAEVSSPSQKSILLRSYFASLNAIYKLDPYLEKILFELRANPAELQELTLGIGSCRELSNYFDVLARNLDFKGVIFNALVGKNKFNTNTTHQFNAIVNENGSITKFDPVRYCANNDTADLDLTSLYEKLSIAKQNLSEEDFKQIWQEAILNFKTFKEFRYREDSTKSESLTPLVQVLGLENIKNIFPKLLAANSLSAIDSALYSIRKIEQELKAVSEISAKFSCNINDYAAAFDYETLEKQAIDWFNNYVKSNPRELINKIRKISELKGIYPLLHNRYKKLIDANLGKNHPNSFSILADLIREGKYTSARKKQVEEMIAAHAKNDYSLKSYALSSILSLFINLAESSSLNLAESHNLVKMKRLLANWKTSPLCDYFFSSRADGKLVPTKVFIDEFAEKNQISTRKSCYMNYDEKSPVDRQRLKARALEALAKLNIDTKVFDQELFKSISNNYDHSYAHQIIYDPRKLSCVAISDILDVIEEIDPNLAAIIKSLNISRLPNIYSKDFKAAFQVAEFKSDFVDLVKSHFDKVLMSLFSEDSLTSLSMLLNYFYLKDFKFFEELSGQIKSQIITDRNSFADFCFRKNSHLNEDQKEEITKELKNISDEEFKLFLYLLGSKSSSVTKFLQEIKYLLFRSINEDQYKDSSILNDIFHLSSLQDTARALSLKSQISTEMQMLKLRKMADEFKKAASIAVHNHIEPCWQEIDLVQPSSPLSISIPRNSSKKVLTNSRAADFYQYRSAVPLDPARDIDWTVYARTDKLVVRQARDQVESKAKYFIVDIDFLLDQKTQDINYRNLQNIIVAVKNQLKHSNDVNLVFTCRGSDLVSFDKAKLKSLLNREKFINENGTKENIQEFVLELIVFLQAYQKALAENKIFDVSPDRTIPSLHKLNTKKSGAVYLMTNDQDQITNSQTAINILAKQGFELKWFKDLLS